MMAIPTASSKRWRRNRPGGYRGLMVLQPTLPWPGTLEPCPKSHGKGDVYYFHARLPGLDAAGGKRVACSVCAGEGRVSVPPQAHTTRRGEPD